MRPQFVPPTGVLADALMCASKRECYSSLRVSKLSGGRLGLSEYVLPRIVCGGEEPCGIYLDNTPPLGNLWNSHTALSQEP